MHYISLPARFLHQSLHLYFSIDGAVVYNFYLVMLDYYDFLLLTRMPKPSMNIFRIFVLFSPNVSNIADSIMHYHVMNGLIPFVLSNYDELLYVTRPLSNVFLFETSERIAFRVMKCDVCQRQCAKIRTYVHAAHALICSTMTNTLVKTVPP